MFSRIMNVLHVLFAWLNAIMCAWQVTQGYLTGALVSGAIAAVLFWQMTW